MIVPGWIPLLVVANLTCIVLCCISGPTASQASPPPPPPHAHLYWWLLRPHQTFFHFYCTSSASDGLQLRWSWAFLLKALKTKERENNAEQPKNKITTNLLLLSCNRILLHNTHLSRSSLILSNSFLVSFTFFTSLWQTRKYLNQLLKN